MKNRRQQNTSTPTALQPGDIEQEMGVPIPGVILEPQGWVQTAIKRLPEKEALDIAAIFGRQAPLSIEIGCGNGRFTISSAVRRPDWDHIAIDILPAVIRYATRRGNQRGLANSRFAVCDGWRFLHDHLPIGSADEIHIYHPQPFADPARASQRMLTPDFLALLHRSLKPDGKVFLQTDRQSYWEYISTVMPLMFSWQERSEPWAEDPYGRSRREILSMDDGLPIFRGIAQKRSDLTDEQAAAIAAECSLPSFSVPKPKRHGNRRDAFRKSRRRR
jgi:tRNA (guanine-N7-)-methyltransferase